MTARPPGDRADDDSRAGPPPGSGHLDTDPEALEDPVHRGDAEHQRESHQHDPQTAPAEPSD